MTTVLRALERSHSDISPSNFGRVAACTASYRLAAAAGRTVSGEDALLGTAAHSVLEWCLRYTRPPEQVEAVHVEGRRFTVDARMRASIEVPLAWVWEHLADRRLLIEHQIRLPWGKITGWLNVATADEPAVVADFKNGHSLVAADAEQLGLYLLALLLERRGSIEGAGEATAVVIQPRAPAEPVRKHTWTYAALRALRDRLIDTLDKIRRDDLSYQEGPHCRWCPAAAVCPHLAAIARDAVATKFAAPELVAAGEFGADTLDAALTMAPALDHWIRQTHAVALEYLVAGGKLPSFKLVKKSSGSFTVTARDDPRPEVDVRATLRAALRSSVALGYRDAARRKTA